MLRIAGETPFARQDLTVTIANALTDDPTTVTVYANGSGGRIHDIAPSIGPIIEGAFPAVLKVAAVAFGQPELYAAALDAGQAFSNGQDFQAC